MQPIKVYDGKMLKHLKLIALIVPVYAFGQFEVNESFNDNAIDSNLWLSYTYYGSGVFSENNEQLEYTCDTDFNYRYLTKAIPASYDQDFTIIFRTSNVIDANDAGEYAQIGVRIFPQFAYDKWLDVNHASYYVSNFGGSRDIVSRFISNSGNSLGTANQPANIFPQSTIIKIYFNSTNKVFSIFYDENPTDGIQWSQLSTFSVGPQNLANNYLNFGMDSGHSFLIHIYGLSYGIEVDPGELIIDDFQAYYSEDTSTNESNAIIFSFESELGKAYRVSKSLSLDNSSSYVDSNIIKSGDLYQLAPSYKGNEWITGTGGLISITDPLNNIPEAFYKIETQ